MAVYFSARSARSFGHKSKRVHYADCRIPIDHLIGERGEGFSLAQKRLGSRRIRHDVRLIGQAIFTFKMMCERALSRVAYGNPFGNTRTVPDMIAEFAVQKKSLHAEELNEM